MTSAFAPFLLAQPPLPKPRQGGFLRGRGLGGRWPIGSLLSLTPNREERGVHSSLPKGGLPTESGQLPKTSASTPATFSVPVTRRFLGCCSTCRLFCNLSDSPLGGSKPRLCGRVRLLGLKGCAIQHDMQAIVHSGRTKAYCTLVTHTRAPWLSHQACAASSHAVLLPSGGHRYTLYTLYSHLWCSASSSLQRRTRLYLVNGSMPCGLPVSWSQWY